MWLGCLPSDEFVRIHLTFAGWNLPRCFRLRSYLQQVDDRHPFCALRASRSGILRTHVIELLVV